MSEPKWIDEVEAAEAKLSTRPWRAAKGDDAFKDWPLLFHAGNSGIDGKDWTITTKDVHASEFDGDAKDDCEGIALLRNNARKLLALARLGEEVVSRCVMYSQDERDGSIDGDVTLDTWQAAQRAVEAREGE